MSWATASDRRAWREVRIDGARARFALTRTLACTPERLWPWLTEPALVARWSSATVELLGPFAAGTERIVQLWLGPLPVFTLYETLTRVEPGRCFEYRGQSVREHHGCAQLDPIESGTELRWTAAFEAPVLGLARPMAVFVARQLAASFDTLAGVL